MEGGGSPTPRFAPARTPGWRWSGAPAPPRGPGATAPALGGGGPAAGSFLPGQAGPRGACHPRPVPPGRGAGGAPGCWGCGCAAASLAHPSSCPPVGRAAGPWPGPRGCPVPQRWPRRGTASGSVEIDPWPLHSSGCCLRPLCPELFFFFLLPFFLITQIFAVGSDQICWSVGKMAFTGGSGEG